MNQPLSVKTLHEGCELIKQHIMFQISVTYAFTEVVHVQSDTLENFGNVDGKRTFDAFFGQIGQD